MDFLSIKAAPTEPEPEYPAPSADPYISIRMGAACCAPHVNEYYANGAYLWVVFEEDGYDLCLEHDSTSDEDRMPAWVDYLLTEFGLAEILGCTDDALAWSMLEGIAPGQTFLVYLESPRTYRSYEGEYDIDWDVWVVRRLPIQSGPRAYERVVDTILRNRRELAEENKARVTL